MEPEQERRRYERYDPELNFLILVSNEYHDEIVGLIRDESRGGCAAVFHRNQFPFNLDNKVVVNTENASDVKSSIRWSKQLDKRFIKVGIEYENNIQLNQDQSKAE